MDAVRWNTSPARAHRGQEEQFCRCCGRPLCPLTAPVGARTLARTGSDMPGLNRIVVAVMLKRQIGWAGAAFSSIIIASVLGAAPASAGAAVLYPDGCGWSAGSVEGIDEFIPATYCQVVVTPSGKLQATLTGQLPEGFTLKQAYVNLNDCVGAGSLVATPSGRVVSHCLVTLD